MKKLNYANEGNSRPVLAAPLGNNWNTYFSAPAGVAVQMPPGAKFLLVVSLDAEVYVKPGTDNTVTVAAPSGDVTDGSAPDLVPAVSTQPFTLDGAAYVAVRSTGRVYLTVYS